MQISKNRLGVEVNRGGRCLFGLSVFSRNVRMVKRMKRDLEENDPSYDVMSSRRGEAITVCDNVEVRFEINSFKMQFPVNSECVLFHNSCEDKSTLVRTD